MKLPLALPAALALSAALSAALPLAAAAQTATTQTLAARPAASEFVPVGTPIALQLETHLSTRDNQYGDGFAARVSQSVYYQGREVIPVGSILEGHVMRVRDERPYRADSELLLKPDQLTTPEGRTYTVSAVVIQGDPNKESAVDSEGVLREPRGVLRSDIHHAEWGGGAGVVGGALVSGAQGALIGGGVGVAVAAGIWLVRRRHLDLNPGSVLTVRLERPLQLSQR